MLDTIQSTIQAFTQMRYEPWQQLGDVLLVGEGNMSFAKGLLDMPAQITQMTATTFEKEKDLTEEALKNANHLKQSGALVMHGIDATKLDTSLKSHQFDTIVFQFPNVGSRESKYGHTANHVLIRKFLRCAASFLNSEGRILITAVDSSHYEGVFKFDEAAEFAEYHAPQSYPFDPSLFSGYSHTNTNDDDSALGDHHKFATWVFKPKQ